MPTEPQEATPHQAEPQYVIEELRMINSDLTIQLAATRAVVRQLSDQLTERRPAPKKRTGPNANSQKDRPGD